MTVAGAFLLALIAGTLHWKRYAPRAVAWLLLAAGIGLSAIILGYVGEFANMTILGVTILAAVLVVTAITFYAEAVKLNGIHRVRTPVVAVLLGVAIASVGGPIGHAVHNINQSGGKNVNKSVTVLNSNR